MGRKRIKQYLTLLLTAGVVAVVASSSGTFASFTAETTNPDNTFETGTIFLHNTANGGTTCTSETSAGNAADCSTLFSNLTPRFAVTAAPVLPAASLPVHVTGVEPT